MIEWALLNKLNAHSQLTDLVENIYIGDAPFNFSYPFIRITSAGENPDNYKLSDRLIESISIDVFAEHNIAKGVFGYTTLSNIATVLRKKFDSFEPERWSDDNSNYDVQNVEYRGFSYRKNDTVFDMHKPITLTITYNIL